MGHAISDSDIPVTYVPKFREIGIDVLDGGTSYIVFQHCPWCGCRLPDSLREQWFEQLERRGIDPYGTGIPEEFQDERWYGKRG